MNIEQKTILITGANRGIGQALVNEALQRFDVPKASPEDGARGIFDGLERGEDDIFPDPASLSIADAWRASVAKALEHQFAAFIQPSAA